MTLSRTWIALLLALTLGVAAPIAGATGVYPVDKQHPLTGQQAIKEFQATGATSANLTVLDLGLTIAEDHEQARMDGWYSDSGKVWFCMDYRESIDRTIRVYIPDAYFTPRPGKLQSVTSNHTATLATRDGEAYTAVTVSFDGANRACFPISKAAGSYWSLKGGFNEWVNNTTGWSPPSFRDDAGQWRSLPETAFDNSTQFRIPTQGRAVSVQYDAAPGPETSWLRVPECSNIAEQPICRYTEQPNQTNRENSTVVLMSTQDTPPPVRWKYGNDTSAGIFAGLRDIGGALDNFFDDLGGWLGGGSSSDSGGGS